MSCAVGVNSLLDGPDDLTDTSKRVGVNDLRWGFFMFGSIR
jgi:hypothetical protein